jgi:hypothetical protein
LNTGSPRSGENLRQFGPPVASASKKITAASGNGCSPSEPIPATTTFKNDGQAKVPKVCQRAECSHGVEKLPSVADRPPVGGSDKGFDVRCLFILKGASRTTTKRAECFVTWYSNKATHRIRSDVPRCAAVESESPSPVPTATYAARHAGHFGMNAKIALGTIQLAKERQRRPALLQQRAVMISPSRNRYRQRDWLRVRNRHGDAPSP